MNEYSGKLAAYYDIIHRDKDYNYEVNFLIETFKIYSSKKCNKIIDIGCGTGNHTRQFDNKKYSVIGVDPSKEMIDIAKKNKVHKNLHFINCNISEVDGQYDLSYSLFNVVNHILRADELMSFFRSIRSLLSKDSLYIFDCYNGLATILDKPRDRIIEKITDENQKLRIATNCEIELFDEKVLLHYKVNYKNDSFQYSIHHRLWTPGILKDILNQ